MTLASWRSAHPSRGDRGDVVLGWLTRVTVTLAVFGVMLFDAVSLGTGTFQADDHAQRAARAAAEAYNQGRDVQQAYDAAVAEVLADGDTVQAPSFSVDAQGRVTLTLERDVPTLVMEKIPPLRRYTTQSRTVTSAAPS